MISKPNKSLLGHLYQRKVMRVGFAYILIGWVIGMTDSGRIFSKSRRILQAILPKPCT
jgi:hypothetical protein